MEQRDALSSLRTSIDSNDLFANAGYRVMKTAGATLHANRMRRVPPWAIDDNRIKEYVLSRFPKADKDYEQRRKAARIVRIIYLYYRVGETRASVAEQLHISDNAVKEVIKRLKAAMSKPLNPPHRTKKKADPIEGTNEDRELNQVILDRGHGDQESQVTHL